MKGKLKETEDKLRSYLDGTIDKRINEQAINEVSDLEIHLMRIEKHTIRGFLIRLFNTDYKTYKILDLYYRERINFLEIGKRVGLGQRAPSRRRTKVVKDLHKLLYLD